MSTNEHISITVRGHDPAREPALLELLASYVKDEGLTGGWDWHAPRVVPARDGGREVQLDSKDAVILRHAAAWQDRARVELARRAAEVNGASCACEVALCDRGGELSTLHRSCDPVVIELLGRVWDDDVDSSLYEAPLGGPEQHAIVAAAYGMLPDQRRRDAWGHLVGASEDSARVPVLAAVMREYLRTPVSHVNGSAWYFHLEVLGALDDGREWDARSVDELQEMSRRVADGANLAEVRFEQRSSHRGPRLGLGGVLPNWSRAHAPFLSLGDRRVLYSLTDETVGLRDWLVARGRMAAPATDDGGIPIELLAEMFRVLLEEHYPAFDCDEALAEMKVERDSIVVPPAGAKGGGAWLSAARDLCEVEALAERVSALAVERLAARNPGS